jgi:hypothetical protein
MARRIRVRGILRAEPDVRLYVLALMDLARQLQAEEEAAKKEAEPTSEAPRVAPEDESGD